MTMHLVGPWLSTTATRQRGEKLTKAKMAELELGWRERNQRLKDMCMPKETFEQYLEWVYGRGKKTKTEEKNKPKAATTVTKTLPGNVTKVQELQRPIRGTESRLADIRKPLWVTGAVSSKPSPVYTGTKIIGIGTMHKSNAVPVFSDDEAKDISSMRR